MKKRILIAVLAVIITALPIFIVKTPEKQHAVLTGELGTVSELTLYGRNSSLMRCSEYIKKADALFSVTNPESEISRINNGEDITPAPDTAEVLALAAEYADAEIFNPFAGALFDLWSNAIKTETLPDKKAVTQAKNSAPKINLGAIAKGYITNKLADILREENVKSALINLGGNIYAHGERPNGTPWQIAVRSPESVDEYIGIIAATDTAVVTSGDYEQVFESGGKRYHHIIDPKTGYPANSGLRSVTVITPDAALADILSTKCFVLGFEESKSVLKEHNVWGIFVTNDGKVFFSEELAEIFSYDNPDYAYEPF